MGKSNAQRQREWRERQKMFNLEEYRKKELDRVNNYKRKQNEKSFKAKHRLATNRWRENKRAMESEQNPPLQSDVSAMSRQSLGKAMKKVRNALPKSPRKSKAVVRALATSLDLMKSTTNHGNGHCIDNEICEKIKNFYRREDIARFMPGAQDVVTIWDENGKHKRQKRILTMTIMEAYNLFKEENPDITVGKSKFAEFRPLEVLLSSKMPRNVCGCIYHENISLLLQELHRIFPEIFPLYGKEFVASCVCDINSKICMSSNCALCKNKFKTLFEEELDINDFQKKTSWYQWEKNEEDGRTEKKQTSGKVENLISILEIKLKKFLYHSFVNKQQTNAYNKCKDLSTHLSSDTVMVQMDFSENYSCVYQDEVSSAHWKTTSVTLFTVMIWFRDQKISMVLLSDNNTHDKTTVVPYTYFVLNHIKEKFSSDVKHCEIWTDGPSSQFKNRFMFAFVGFTLQKSFDFSVSWNYSATSHGKGAVDGIGGLIKRLATSATVTRKAIIKNADSMFQAINEKTNIYLSVMTSHYINETYATLQLDSLWEDLNTLPGTMHIHSVEQTEQAGVVKTKFFKDDVVFSISALKGINNGGQSETNERTVIYSNGDYVIVKYDNIFYPGEIINVNKEKRSALIRTMEKSGPQFWKWPNREDILEYPFQQIVKTINPPTVVSNRGTFSVSELKFV